ncbi:MAG: chloride channel protein [Clostridia bacterium]|nr:chloride channel protein [Clostridia bacterium]
MQKFIAVVKKQGKNLLGFAKWVLIGLLIGGVVGLVGTAFAYSITFATDFRMTHPWVLYLLPVLGLAIVWLYNRAHMEDQPGTNMILLSVRSKQNVPFAVAPVIFATSFLTHFGGGSAGREGAALQIGGGVAQQIGRWMKADEHAMHIFSMCGMSACFSCLFGTPVTAAVFAMEVVRVGVMQYSALIPCAVAALAADFIARLLGVHHMHFSIAELSVPFDMLTGGRVLLLAAAAGLVSVLFCIVLNKVAHVYEKYIRNRYVRIVVGGVLVIALTLLLGTRDYLGAGEEIIQAALSGSARWEAFLLKILFTAVTLEAGYKGGEIVPSLFIGATLGCVLGGIVGLPPAFAAAIAMIGVFCGATNCPLASVLLGLELFGGAGIEWFLLTVAVSYVLSGYYGLYSQQKIVYAKDHEEKIDVYTHA